MSRMRSTVIVMALAVMQAGCATTAGPRQIDPEWRGAAGISNWSRVSELAPAAELAVTVKRSQPRRRYFVAADATAVTLLNLTDTALPAASTRVLREMALRHPDYFAAMQRSGTFQQGDVQVGRDGVIVAGRKVAELGQVLEIIARGDVAEIEGPVIARGSVLGPLLGGWLGFAIGAVPALGGAAGSVAFPLLIGSVAVGGYLGFHWSSHQTQGLVYRAP